jgi:hypothetical protein
MTVTASEPAATMSVEDNPSEMLARRLRAHLQAFATLRLPITYREAAKGLLLSPPNTIHQVTEALEQLLAEDAAPTAPSSRPWSSASGAAACRHRGSSTVRVGSDASPAMQRDRTQGYFMRSSSTRCSPCGRRLATRARLRRRPDRRGGEPHLAGTYRPLFGTARRPARRRRPRRRRALQIFIKAG